MRQIPFDLACETGVYSRIVKNRFAGIILNSR